VTTKGGKARSVSPFEFVSALLILSGSVILGPPNRATGQVTSGEWLVHWSPAGAFAIHETEPRCVPIYSNSYETCETWTDDSPCPEGWFYRRTHRVLSALGNFVSFTDGYEGSGGMHPISGRRYAAIDLNTREPADITQLFDESDVVAALAGHPLIRKHLRGAAPEDLDGMVTALGRPCEIAFYDLPSAFRVKSVGGTTAVVEFGLAHGCEVLRGTFTAIEIELPIPHDLSDLFLEARRTLPRFPEEDPVVVSVAN
jgi:hypothetical protein